MFLKVIGLLSYLFFLSLTCHAQDCGTNQPRIDNKGTRIEVKNTTYRKLTPQFFGFNLELIEFENSLWNMKSRSVEPSVIQYLQRFPGAVFRYPGGTTGNHFDWKSATGPLSSRPAQRIVDWQPARDVQFGPVEYLEFVKQVGGTAWYVLNLYGSLQASQPTQHLANSAAELASFMSSQRSLGLPKIYRWELGNELDRGQVRWPASKYITVAKAISASVRSNYDSAEFVAMLQDWAHTGASTPGVNYNTTVARELSLDSTGFAAHLYYDGAPWGPPMPRLLRQFCTNFDDVRSGAPSATMWVTEHARTPLGTPDDPRWKKNWPQTGSLAAAISSADMMITLARSKNVNGAFIHALHGTNGPWPLFHKRSDGTIYPGPVYWAILLLRETLLDEVLNSNVSTTNQGANGVGYVTNAAVLADSGRTRFTVWLVNRSEVKSVTRFNIPQLAGKRVVAKFAHLSGDNPMDSNYDTPYKVFPVRGEVLVDVDPGGEFSLFVPAYSVYVAGLDISQNR